MESVKCRVISISEEFRQILSIMSFEGRLGEEMASPDGAFNKGIKTYKISACLEIVPCLEGKATRLMVSRHSGSNSGLKVSK